MARRPSRFHSCASASECSFTLRLRSVGCGSPAATDRDCKRLSRSSRRLDKCSSSRNLTRVCRRASASVRLGTDVRERNSPHPAGRGNRAAGRQGERHHMHKDHRSRAPLPGGLRARSPSSRSRRPRRRRRVTPTLVLRATRTAQDARVHDDHASSKSRRSDGTTGRHHARRELDGHVFNWTSTVAGRRRCIVKGGPDANVVRVPVSTRSTDDGPERCPTTAASRTASATSSSAPTACTSRGEPGDRRREGRRPPRRSRPATSPTFTITVTNTGDVDADADYVVHLTLHCDGGSVAQSRAATPTRTFGAGEVRTYTCSVDTELTDAGRRGQQPPAPSGMYGGDRRSSDCARATVDC